MFKVKGIVHRYSDQCGFKAVKDTDKGGESAQLAQTTVTTVHEGLKSSVVSCWGTSEICFCGTQQDLDIQRLELDIFGTFYFFPV